MKKIFLTIGAISAISFPIISFVACGEGSNDKDISTIKKTNVISLRKVTSKEDWEFAIDDQIKKDIENTYDPTLVKGLKNLVDFESNSTVNVVSESSSVSNLFGQKLPSWFSLPNSITKIGKSSFEGVTLNPSFEIPNSVNEIMEFAFMRSVLNDSFALPKDLTKIGPRVFYETTLNDSFQIPQAVTVIEHGAFLSATLNDNFSIPSSVTQLDKFSFLRAKLNRSFKIPETVKTIDSSAFSYAILPKGYSWSDNPVIPGSHLIHKSQK